jgi:multidrug efflux pump subunit AcrA (membrane-fusion protein)
LDAKERELASTIICSPIDGTITSISAVRGQFVTKGALLAQIVDTANIQISASVPTAIIPALKVGMKCAFTIEAETSDCEISFISPVVDTNTGTVRIKARITQKTPNLRPNAFGVLAIEKK